MALSVMPGMGTADIKSTTPNAPMSARETAEQDIRQRFEQMLWAEMLSHAGLEKALTQGGGEAASSFSRYVVESIAKDLAATHPLGLGEHVDLPSSENPAANLETPK